MNKVKEAWQSLSKKAQRLLLIVSLAAIAFVVIGAVLLGRSQNKTVYTTLFSGLSSDEAKQVVSLIQEQNVEYTYDGKSGSIQVPKDQADKLRADLLSQGYPKSGFTYDMYVNNSGLMATESDKKQYSLYELQDRLGSTIRLFDGVQDAKVTIAKEDDDTYALSSDDDDDDSQQKASASVVVTMQQGETLSNKNAEAIRNLVARSVKGMKFTNVSVFDATTGTEIGGSSGDSDDSASSNVDDQTTKLESNISANVKRVLGKLYDEDNVAVSVKGTLDTSSHVTENTQYSVPVQKDATDKEGLLSKESNSSSYTGSGAGNAGGTAGTDANADTPQYTTQTGGQGDSNSSSDSDSTKEYLYNTSKEQTTTEPGTLQNLTVAVVIDTADMSVDDGTLKELIADAAGIDRANADQSVSVVRSGKTTEDQNTNNRNTTENRNSNNRNLLLLVILVAAVLAAVFILLRILRSRKDRQIEREMEAAEAEAQARAQAEAERKAKEAAEAAEKENAPDAHVARGEELKGTIGDFVDDNPQAAAKLVQSWLRDEENNGGRRKHRK